MSNGPRVMIVVGVIFVVLGLFWAYLPRFHLGRLPGDIAIERENFRFYFPVTTSILISVIVSVIVFLVRAFSK